ncbi:MAG: DUF4129 domain-containing protein [Bacillota bacterium]
MSDKKIPTLFLTAAGMELSWLLAAGTFLASFFGITSYYLLQAPLAFFLGAGLTLFTRRKNCRVITRLGLQLLLLATLFMLTLYYNSYRGEIFWSRGWIGTLLQGPHDLAQGLLWGVAAILTLIFWCGGVFLARRSLNYFSTASRFDVGVTAFILIFILIGVTGAPALPAMLLLFPFFLFSMLAIALARNRQGDVRGIFLQKYRGGGPILAFAAAVLLGGSAVLLLFYPLLIQAAIAGYDVLQHYGPPLTNFLGRLILFFFGYGARFRRSPPAESTSDSFLLDPAAAADGEAGFWELLLSWGSIVILFVMLVFIIAWMGWRLFRWLWSGKDTSGRRQAFRVMWRTYLQQWYLCLQSVLARARRCLSRLKAGQRSGTASYFFWRLLSWGSGSGLSRLVTETPREYGRVLGRYFPALQPEIDLIVNCYHDEIYGEMVLDGGKKRKLQRAWRRLCNPRSWPARLRSRLLNASGSREQGFDEA